VNDFIEKLKTFKKLKALSLTGNPFENTENDFMDLIAIGLPSCV
jgi:hypothetical protein